MDSHPTVQSNIFDEEAAPNDFNAYKISIENKKKAVITVSLTQKQYNSSDPTWFSLTIVSHNTGIPDGYDLTYNYHDSIVACDQTINVTFKGPFKGKVLFLMVDGIWKDKITVESYKLSIDCSTPAQIT